MSTEHIIIEFVNAFVALGVIYFGVRLLPRFSLSLQKVAIRFYLLALTFFSLGELLSVVHVLGWIPEQDLLRELAETGFLTFAVISFYMTYQSDHREVKVLRRRANTDLLTGLKNHAFFRRAAQRRFEKAQRYNTPLALIFLDVDKFKSYNDKFGHEAGNVVLSALAEVLIDTVRADDMVGRYGGEEFVVMISDNLENACSTAERIRAKVETFCTPANNPRLHRNITVSLGVAHVTEGTGSVEALIKAADQQMYRAKIDGRNRVKIESAAQITNSISLAG